MEGKEPVLTKSVHAFGALTECENVVCEVLRAIVEGAADVVYQHALAELELPTGLALAFQDLPQLFSLATLSAERSDDTIISQGREPMPVEVDSWARGSVPWRIPSSPIATCPELRGMDTSDSGRPSSGSDNGDSHRSLKKYEKGEQQQKRKMRESSKHQGEDEILGHRESLQWSTQTGEDDKGSIATEGGKRKSSGEGVEGILELSKELNPDQEHRVHVAMMIGLRAEDRVYLESLRRSDKIRTIGVEEEDANVKAGLPRNENRIHVEKKIKDFKGKEWTVDCSGEIIVVEPLPPESMPHLQEPQVEVRDVQHPADIKERSQQRPSQRGRQRGKKGGAKRSVERARRKTLSGQGQWTGGKMVGQGVQSRPSSGFFEIASTLQPLLLESMELCPGVLVEQDGDVREGPGLEKDASHMSRQDFLALTSTKASPHRGLSVDVNCTRKRVHLKSKVICQSPATLPLDKFPRGEIDKDDNTSHVSALGRSMESIADSVRTFDPLSGSVRRPEGLVGSSSRGLLDGKDGSSVGPVGNNPEDDTPYWNSLQDIDRGSIAGSDWSGGRVERGRPVPSAPVPHKPGTEERRRLVQQNPLGKGLRDRSSRHTQPTVMHKHLPPPPLGETMRHGFNSPPRPLRKGEGEGREPHNTARRENSMGSNSSLPSKAPSSLISPLGNWGGRSAKVSLPVLQAGEHHDISYEKVRVDISLASVGGIGSVISSLSKEMSEIGCGVRQVGQGAPLFMPQKPKQDGRTGYYGKHRRGSGRIITRQSQGTIKALMLH